MNEENKTDILNFYYISKDLLKLTMEDMANLPSDFISFWIRGTELANKESKKNKPNNNATSKARSLL